MSNKEKLVVCMGKGAQKDAAVALAKRVNAPLVDKPGEYLTLLIDKNGVSLNGYGLTFRGDFEDSMLRRLTDGRLQHEMLVHVATMKDAGTKEKMSGVMKDATGRETISTDNDFMEKRPTAIDATAGMGEDSILLAACGYDVIMYEQNPVIAALLRDALRRAKKHPILKDIVSHMTLVEGNSIELIPKRLDPPDVIYLDPMFPARQKSGLINKKLQLIQKLEQPCFDEEGLLEAAFLAKPNKIIIKRPLKGPYLADKTPAYSVKGKAIRYDCITNI